MDFKKDLGETFQKCRKIHLENLTHFTRWTRHTSSPTKMKNCSRTSPMMALQQMLFGTWLGPSQPPGASVTVPEECQSVPFWSHRAHSNASLCRGFQIGVTSLHNPLIHRLRNKILFLISLQHCWAFVTQGSW